MDKPKFQHDCERCVFLGHYHNHDVYLCIGSEGGSGSIIARYGDEASENASSSLAVIAIVLENRDNREQIEYVKAWIDALQGDKFKQMMKVVGKLIELADTLQGYASQSNSDLAT